MNEQEQYAHLAAGFAKLDNARRNSLDEYTRQLVQIHLQDTEVQFKEAQNRINSGENGSVLLKNEHR
jgi:hypothetical protein